MNYRHIYMLIIERAKSEEKYGIITIRCKPNEVPDGFMPGILRKNKYDS